MPEPSTTLGAVYWSREARRFYQEGRRGALSVLEALEHLTQSRVGLGIGFRDERSIAVPSLAEILPREFKVRTFLQERNARLTSADVYSKRAPKSTYYTTLATWVDDAGRLHVDSRAFRASSVINRELEERKLAAAIKTHLDKEKVVEDTPTTLRRIRMAIHFVVS